MVGGTYMVTLRRRNATRRKLLVCETRKSPIDQCMLWVMEGYMYIGSTDDTVEAPEACDPRSQPQLVESGGL